MRERMVGNERNDNPQMIPELIEKNMKGEEGRCRLKQSQQTRKVLKSIQQLQASTDYNYNKI